MSIGEFFLSKREPRPLLNMHAILYSSLAALTSALFLTPLMRGIGQASGLVDVPDRGRKRHLTPVPRLGGAAIVLAYLLACGAQRNFSLAASVAPAVLVVFAVGLLDDLRPIGPGWKFTGQLLAASIAWLAGIHITGPAGLTIPHWIGFPLTIFWLVLCSNAFNLIDGIDGVAAGAGAFCAAALLIAALLQHNADLALATAPLLFCLIGFLRYNFFPASIFLGDSGSLAIGFFLGCCSIVWSHGSATAAGMAAPALALSIPLLDTLLTVTRRFLSKQPVFSADRGHIHHRLLDRGHTPSQVALTMYAFCALASILSLSMLWQPFEKPAILFFCAAAWFAIRRLEFTEFRIAGRMVRDFRHRLQAAIAVDHFEQRLHAAATVAAFWRVVEESAPGFGFHGVEMVLNGQRYVWRTEDADAESCTIRIRLSESDFVECTQSLEADSSAACARALRNAAAEFPKKSPPIGKQEGFRWFDKLIENAKSAIARLARVS